MHFDPWWGSPPTIVAEALSTVPEPLSTALRPGPSASASLVVASMAVSLSPAEHSSPAPAWLLEAQQVSFRRAVAAILQYHGALLADPVGSGKTYIALAVAAALNGGKPTACLVPAALLAQWKATAAALNVPVVLGSHEQASRGGLPAGTRGLVVIDESHHFRNQLTRRYVNVAGWLVGRPALLVSATPVVNRMVDLGNQLLLAVRDNVLAIDGVPSLRLMLARNQAHPALGQLVLEHDSAAAARPRKAASICDPTRQESAQLDRALELIGRLSLSQTRSVALLVRGVLLWAAASSPAALCGSLHRYRRLLLNARDAVHAGCVLDRREIRRFTAHLGDQLVWWELLPTVNATAGLELGDLPTLDQLIPATSLATEEPDDKLRRLRDILNQGSPTLVFSGSCDTVRYIRHRLEDSKLAWCTGRNAGIGRVRLPRDTVLGWFRQNGSVLSAANHLILTDLAAEGLDLQHASRVVHYDLPWTPMRLEQREGRAARLGSRHSKVEIFRFNPPPSIDRLLRIQATLARKAKLPEMMGLGEKGRSIWRWRSQLAVELGRGTAIAGVAKISSPHPGLLAGVRLYRPGSPATAVSTVVGWLDPTGAWTEDPDVVTCRLRAAACETGSAPKVSELRPYLELLTPIIRQRLALTRGGRWLGADPSSSSRSLAMRLGELIRNAARQRQQTRLSELESLLRFVSGGHTAGEELLLKQMVGAEERRILKGLKGTLPQSEWTGIEVDLTGLILFGT